MTSVEALEVMMKEAVTNNKMGIFGAMGRYQRHIGPYDRPTAVGWADARPVVDLGARASVVGC